MEHSWIKKRHLIRSLIKELEQHPNIVKIKKIKNDTVRVIYDTGIIEIWSTEKSPSCSAWVKSKFVKLPLNNDIKPLLNKYEPPYYKQFEINKDLYPDEYELLKPFFIVRFKDFKKMGWFNRRIWIQELALQLKTEGLSRPQYSDRILFNEWYNIQSIDINKHQQNIIRFKSLSRTEEKLGDKLLIHFVFPLKNEHWTFENLHYAIHDLTKKKKDITYESIITEMIKHQTALVKENIPLYRSIFQKWINVNNQPVLDIAPGWGDRFLAASLSNGIYYCSDEYKQQLDNLSKFVNHKIYNENDTDDYKYIISSFLKPSTIKEIDNIVDIHKNKSKYLIFSIRNDVNSYNRIKKRYLLKKGMKIFLRNKYRTIIMIKI